MNQTVIRNYQESDFEALLDLARAVEAADQAGTDTSPANLQSRLNLPGFQPGLDQWLAISPEGCLIGQTGVWVPEGSETAFIALSVHPEARRKGLGSQLLAAASRRGREAGARRVALNVWQPGAAGHIFLLHHGFRLAGHYSRFSASLPLRNRMLHFPAGFTVQSFARVGSLEILARAYEQCYQGLWGHHTRVTLAELNEWMSGLDPEGILLVFNQGQQVVGMCRVEINAELSSERGVNVGYIDAPGWVIGERSPEHTSALLYLAADTLGGRGAVQTVLESWGDPPETLLLFQQVGFCLERQVSEYGMELV